MIYKDEKLTRRPYITPSMSETHPLYATYLLIDKLNNELDEINKTYNHRIHGLPVPDRIIEINKEKSQLTEQVRDILANNSMWGYNEDI